MEHRIAYSELSEEGRQAWETISGLPMTTAEQHRHAWRVLRSELTWLDDDPRAGLYVFANVHNAVGCDLYVSGPELAALRVMIAWLKANDRAGRMRDLPIYPDLAEVIVGQLGEMPWPGVWEAGYLHQLDIGGTLSLHPRTQALVLAQTLELTLRHAAHLCPGWPAAEREYLLSLLADVARWLQSMLVAHDHETAA